MRYYVIIALLLAFSLPIGYWLLRGVDTAPVDIMPESTSSAAVDPDPVQQPQLQQTQSDSGKDTGALEMDKYHRLKSLGLTEEEIANRERLHELEQAANRRFDDAVNADSLQANQVRPAVRSLFKTMTLEPAFDPENNVEGFVDGMRIAELASINPLARAGFQQGDRLVSFDGYPLQDPAEIAHLFTQLGEQFEVCARRSEDRLCRIVSLNES